MTSKQELRQSIFNFFFYIGVVVGLALLMSSCYTERTAQRQVLKAQSHFPDVVAGNCGDWYPPITDSYYVEKLLPGKNVVGPTKYVQANCDSVRKQNERNGNPNAPIYLDVPCPPDTTRVDTFVKEKIVNRENTAKVKSLESEVNRLEKYEVLTWVLAGLCLLLILILVFKRK